MFKKLAKWIREFGGFDPKEVQGSKELYAELIINPRDGAVSTEVHNGNGKNCLALTAQIEQSMGGTTERQMKPEANRVVREGGKTRQTGRSRGDNTLRH